MPGATFLGRLPVEELAEVYASSDIFLFPSATETFGNVTIEAMASGLVPVVADEGGSRFIVAHGENGLVCAARDAEAYADAVLRLVADPALRTRLQAGALASAGTFSWTSTLAQLDGVYARGIRRCAARGRRPESDAVGRVDGVTVEAGAELPLPLGQSR